MYPLIFLLKAQGYCPVLIYKAYLTFSNLLMYSFLNCKRLSCRYPSLRSLCTAYATSFGKIDSKSFSCDMIDRINAHTAMHTSSNNIDWAAFRGHASSPVRLTCMCYILIMMICHTIIMTLCNYSSLVCYSPF